MASAALVADDENEMCEAGSGASYAAKDVVITSSAGVPVAAPSVGGASAIVLCDVEAVVALDETTPVVNFEAAVASAATTAAALPAPCCHDVENADLNATAIDIVDDDVYSVVDEDVVMSLETATFYSADMDISAPCSSEVLLWDDFYASNVAVASCNNFSFAAAQDSQYMTEDVLMEDTPPDPAGSLVAAPPLGAFSFGTSCLGAVSALGAYSVGASSPAAVSPPPAAASPPATVKLTASSTTTPAPAIA
ncbi:hypothetical protein [Parasitella parasitica]|uniref:Uncharacterized protein n=1 Tax=Parasitella parasitica TaxID=35722 RepID=A0A0B7NMI4_9FUNG|nr:hypothetical protein [Parasitella parasitica]